jgi:hypothetical protein
MSGTHHSCTTSVAPASRLKFHNIHNITGSFGRGIVDGLALVLLCGRNAQQVDPLPRGVPGSCAPCPIPTRGKPQCLPRGQGVAEQAKFRRTGRPSQVIDAGRRPRPSKNIAHVWYSHYSQCLSIDALGKHTIYTLCSAIISFNHT